MGGGGRELRSGDRGGKSRQGKAREGSLSTAKATAWLGPGAEDWCGWKRRGTEQKAHTAGNA